ncbi:MAG: YlbF family regulator [Tepidisphaeraceae bacterium]
MPADTQEILDAAKKVGDLLATHPAVEKYKAAQKALSDDPDASRLLSEFNTVLTQISHNERAGLSPTEDQRKKYELLQTQISSHLKFKSYSMAEYELTDLLRKVSQTWQKPLAKERGGAGAAPAGPSFAL